MLSKRAQETSKNDFLLINFLKTMSSSYDEATNPQGYVNLGTSENKICEDIWLEKITEISESADHVTADILYYYEYHGMSRVRKTFSKFIEDRFKSKMKIQEEKIILLSGVATTINALAFTLADVGDVFLCPTPAYTRLKYDMLDIGGVDIYEVPMFDDESSDDPCKMRSDVLESYLLKAKQRGLTVRGVILTSPSNPTGKVYTKQELADLMEFCKREDLHVIFDEIYALSTQGQGCFTSVLSMTIPDPDKTHFIWGLSKDFGLSGFRCGVVYSHDVRVINYLQKMATFCSIPAPTQLLINDILSDTEWIDKTYFPTYYTRAKENHKLVKDVLDDFKIPTSYSCENVIFFWMDLSQFLNERTKEEEIKLFNKFMDTGLYICPGTELLCPIPGWFRLTYTYPKRDVEEGIRRFVAVLTAIRKEDSFERLKQFQS
ncbi:probable inactive 1-aminocyclopropane-1-carboxylate synthase-like protein 2 [Mizuhopecten yessoensis]|uniref:Inactive 1-aminocyclopropane-1-carboxylate synthase-like protein 2 n=1 Tax=Mizuhopecten yessoensis TaxID=6573 RepID=A0A210R4X8_MIZYE|nr:probable inactive 1-aminocyclopropane-1-carboxylate synthase-like protein 2 [Mizuhopecten yessoensis]OWF56070.1 inactive 1-aminocyclopropane-1-carboxylate synthase-like protein 2 [Mizuhopecten yessoensis]